MSFEIRTTEYGKISGSFSQASLAKLCVKKIGVQTGPFGSQLHNEDYVVIGTPIITVEHLGENRITYKNMPCVSDEDKARLSKYCLQEGDIVFSRVGSVDRRALVRQEEDGWLFSGRCLRVRVDKEKIDPVYLSYFFGLEGFKNYIKSIAVGATMPSLNTKILSDVPIYFPELEKQKNIGKILQEFDDKIELNRQINQTIEAMAQAIFKSWFVDFEPVKAKISAIEAGEDIEGVTRAAMSAISGKTDEELDKLRAEQPEHYTQLKTTAELFPVAMQDSKMGEIPEGWKVKQLDHLANYQNGLALQDFRPENENDYLPVLKIAQLKKGFADGDERASINIKPACIVENGDVVFSWSGSLMVEIWCGGKAALNQHLFKVTSNEYPKWFYYYWTKHHLNEFQRIAADKAVTMGHIKREHLSGALCVTPHDTIFKDLSKIISDLLVKAIEVRLENFTLKELRDILLPKLLSGELSVEAIELADV